MPWNHHILVGEIPIFWISLVLHGSIPASWHGIQLHRIGTRHTLLGPPRNCGDVKSWRFAKEEQCVSLNTLWIPWFAANRVPFLVNWLRKKGGSRISSYRNNLKCTIFNQQNDRKTNMIGLVKSQCRPDLQEQIAMKHHHWTGKW